ncbi:hypothetical protein CORC01_07585 [Colletotrichum orchidophilum]|uniref:Uncharacterized protein n=1 Tax=Colletotrichum orchidophilum TaxID=1209926 RepID=A0A1G4B6X1_9PEZI|nr:uncharacterized protein CORC01_07585 [Colletotrichum orchidophilum]OHE97144.1 hypothetical protein CORC01_07585 [Colletotrichum orchidophilum]
MSPTDTSIIVEQCDKLEELQTLFIYRRTMTDFMWGQVPVTETQVALRQLVHIANEEKIQYVFTKFLNAPTESP